MKLFVEIEKQDFLFDFVAFLDSPRELITLLLIEAVRFSQGSFDRQGLFQENEWWPPGPVNTASLWKDFNMGKNPPARRVDPNRKALQDTGRLRKSITWKLISDTEGVYGTNVPYASDHFYGNDMRLQKFISNKEMGIRIEKFLKRHGSKLSEKNKQKIRKMKRAKFLRVKIPERKFLGIPGDSIIDIVLEYLEDRYNVKA